jgi:hypothetical protein
MKSKRFSILSGVGLAMMFAMASTAAATTHPPDINPANFVHPSTNPNPFFPLVPGTTFNYTGEKDGVPNTNVTQVTCDTLVIEGVTTTVVHDQALDASGTVEEDTFDYYAQDKDGNVWYFGEDTIELATGSTEGTWRAGVDDADPGIIMEAHPQVGDRYYQEFAPKVAVDQAKVISLSGSATVLYGSFENLLVTKETSQLDPGVVENKYYAAGIGFILAETVKGGDERTELVSITNSPCP